MPVIKFNGQQFALQPGANRLGGPGADVVVGGSEILAVVELGGDGRATIRKSGEQAAVKVNGTPLYQPTPLMHGDKVEIAGQELLFADDAKVGATQFVSAADVAAIAAAKRSGPARATATTGGRLVSLVDGKEYSVPDAGVVIGRDASADIVVAQTSVSRRHAEVVPGPNGYVVNDLSTNGLFVNGEKVNGSQPLSRSDVIQVGTEQFRFYADVAKAGAGVGAPPAAPPKQPAAPPAPVAAPAPPPAAAAAPPPPPPRAPASPPTPASRPATPPPAPAAPPKPAAPPTPAAPKPTAPTPAPATERVSTLPVTTLPSKSAPAAPPAPPAAEPATKKTVPMWVGVAIIVVLAAAFAAYFLMQPR
jgi:hypothetical protein